jgi:hypothetical protein
MEIIAAGSLIALANHFKGSQVLSRPLPKVREGDPSKPDLLDSRARKAPSARSRAFGHGKRKHSTQAPGQRAQSLWVGSLGGITASAGKLRSADFIEVF